MPKCFIIYSTPESEEFVNRAVIPILRDNHNNIAVRIEREEISFGGNIISKIVKGILEADFIICVFDRYSFYLELEIATAFGANKPIIALVEGNLNISPNIFNSTYVIRYDRNGFNYSHTQLKKSVRVLTEQVIDKITLQNTMHGNKIIGIAVGNEFNDFELELRFIAEFIKFVKNNTRNPKINLIQSSKGSFKSLINIDLTSLAELVEKIIFIIPELKKRKLDRIKVEADINKTNAETREINIETDIKQAEAFAKLLKKYQKLGITIQMDRDLLITQTAEGILTFKTPENLE